MSARPNEAKPKPETASRLAHVLRTGVAYNAQKKALAEQTNLLSLGKDLIYEIMDMVKSPLQTCEIVGIMREQGWYETATPTQLLQLIRLLFFDTRIETVTDRPANTDAENLAVALAHVQQVLVNNFGQINDKTPVAWLKKVLRRLCDGYARASTAIRAMEKIQPWEDGFVWGAGPDGASIEIPDSVVAPYPLSTAWHTQTTIVTFLPLQAAKNLTASYRRLLDSEESEKARLKELNKGKMEYQISKYGADAPDFVEAKMLGRPAREYNARYDEWLASREKVAKSPPKEFENKDWLPMHERPRLKSMVMRIDPDEGRILSYDLYAVDEMNGEREKRLVATEYVHGQDIL